MQIGTNRERLKAGVSLLQEIPWSTTPVEQAHASAACLQRYHPEYGTSMLAARATLHQCRHLFLTPPEVRKAEKTEARLAALQKKNPFKLRGSNLFLAELIGGCKEAAPKEANMSQTFTRQVMKNHSGYWDGLTLEEQAKYRKQAQDQAAQMSETQQDDIRHLQDAMLLQKTRLDEELLATGLGNDIKSVRFTNEDYQKMEVIRQRADFSPGRVLADRRRESTAPPQELSDDVAQALDRCGDSATPETENQQPSWMKDLCWRRSDFLGCATGVSFEIGARAYYFAYATQSPLLAHFIPMIVGDTAQPCIDSLSPTDAMDAWDESHFYVCL